MVNTLLLRLSGALQSWGLQSHFTIRDTALEPTKSGVIGLLCASLGRDRKSSLQDLYTLRMGVRVDEEGVLYRDFHTASHVFRASGGIKETETSSRYYLAGARFLVGLESGDLAFLNLLHDALSNPVWPQFLGRKACVPGEPVWLRDGLQIGTDLLKSLSKYPWLGCDASRCPDSLRIMIEKSDGSIQRPDQPLSFHKRTFIMRTVEVDYVDVPRGDVEDRLCISHN